MVRGLSNSEASSLLSLGLNLEKSPLFLSWELILHGKKMRVLKRGEQGECCYFKKGMSLPKKFIYCPEYSQFHPLFTWDNPRPPQERRAKAPQGNFSWLWPPKIILPRCIHVFRHFGARFVGSYQSQVLEWGNPWGNCPFGLLWGWFLSFCLENLWIPHLWQCPRPGWRGLGARFS